MSCRFRWVLHTRPRQPLFCTLFLGSNWQNGIDADTCLIPSDSSEWLIFSPGDSQRIPSIAPPSGQVVCNLYWSHWLLLKTSIKYIPVMRLLIIMYLAKIYRKTSTIEAQGILFMKRPDRKSFSSTWLSLEFDLNQRISFFLPLTMQLN